jgi:hypothetical protein
MTLITHEQTDSALSGHVAEIIEQLNLLKADLRTVQGYVQSEEPGHIREALRAAGDVRQFIKHAYDVEAKYNDEQRKHLGIAGDFGFDLDTARAEIAGKLDRLRECIGTTVVSG